MTFDAKLFEKYKKDFIKATKKVLKEKISKNPEKLKEYETEIIKLHDVISAYIAPYYDKFNSNDQAIYRNELVYIRDKTLKCFGALNSKKHVSKFIIEILGNEIELTDESDSNAEDSDTEEDNFHSSKSNDSIEIENDLNDLMSDDKDLTIKPSITQNKTEISSKSTSDTKEKMAISLLEYLRFAASTLNKNYSGDPLSLNAFINSVELVKSVDTDKQFIEQLTTFVLAKLEGKALECVPQDGTLENILKALKDNIKPENSKVISGRMLSLRFNKNSASNFSAEAEKLADALQRSLIVEGISQSKAKEMAVERTVEMCRQSAKSDLVRSVLAAATFNDPKDVIAKLITEQNTHETEKQILAFNRQGNFRKNNGRFNGNKNFNNRQNGYKNYNQNYNQNNNQYNSQNNSQRGGFQNKRGRGRGNYHNNRNNGNYNIHVAENYGSPSTSDGQNNAQSNAQNNQTFSLERANNRS